MVKLSEKHQTSAVASNVNAKCAHYMAQLIQRSMLTPGAKRQVSRTIDFDSARICLKFIEMFKIVVEESCSGDYERVSSAAEISQWQLARAYKPIERLMLLKPLDVYKTLWNLFDVSFKKCELIYTSHKHEEDSKLSHANLESHNNQQQQQQLESASNQTASTEPDNNNDSDNIRGF